MRIKNLNLKNIGPFNEASIDFIGDQNSIEKPPITIITGENGTGKTIILDTIRGLLLGQFNKIERNIVRNIDDFFIKADFSIPQIANNVFEFSPDISIETKKIEKNNVFITSNTSISRKLSSPNTEKTMWVTNYWTSRLSTDSFDIKSLVAPKPENYLLNSLNGIQPNVEVTQLICFFDYLRSSMSKGESELGEFLYDLLKKIIKLSLIDGEFKFVERQTLTPIIHQTGGDISLDKLSSGNLYLIQRLISLLGQMYSVHILNNTNIKDLCEVPGLLLIDEAENHLHPKWQKTFLNSIIDIFPKLQIIVTTHSPFIVSSVKNANIYVCKSMKDHSIIENKTEEYSNKPIEEILISPIFNTNSFNTEISELIIQRKNFIQNNEIEKANEIEKKLLKINPEYFSYFEIENIIKKISK
jgi:predicted ATP-binding protein involved in virulence